MYSKDIIDSVKAAINIVDIIRDYQTLTKRGKYYIGVCPFHADSAPSLTVTPSMQIYKCFACGASGDVFTYVQHAEGCTFREAVEIVAKKAHITLPEDTSESEEDRKARAERETLKKENEKRQAEFLRDRGDAFEAYLRERKISQEAADAFGMGYAQSGEFVGRVTYPIYTASGVLAGWTGRAVQAIGDKKQVAKYKNSAESVLFHKDELLFGLKQAKAEIQRKDRVYIVEGQNDVIRMWMSGIQNTVAGSGTAFGEKQARLLQRFTQNAVLMYDGDKAGRSATLKTMQILLSMGFSVWVCRLPEGEDPDSWLLQTSKKQEDIDWQVVVYNATMKWDKYLQVVYPYVDDADEVLRNATETSKMIAIVPNRLVRTQLMYQAAVYYHAEASEIKRIVAAQKVPEGEWQQGLYGIEDAIQKGNGRVYLTFEKETFMDHIDDATDSWVLYQGEKQETLIQRFRFTDLVMVLEREASTDNAVLRALHADGRHVCVLIGEEEDQQTYTDWYISRYTDQLQSNELSSADRTQIVRRCVSVIADTDGTEREINRQEYIRALSLQATSYKAILQEYLNEKRDRREAERKRQNMEDKTTGIDLYELPDYVKQDEVLYKQYNQYGFFPLMSHGDDPHPVAYVFKNEKGEGHTVVSDFYMEALLFVDPSTEHSKRVIRLNHLHGTRQYVEWPSDVFVSLNDIKKRLFSSGAYNFNGTPQQWDKIRQQFSYNFTECYEARVYGWQPENFLMLPNAVYYFHENKWTLQYMDNLGVAEVETMQGKMRFYSPASSSIRLSQRQAESPYEQDELSFYMEPTEKDRIDFAQWATLMNEVFTVNDNGKWAVMFAIVCNFRDLIYSAIGNFTALCFAGPTGSGKTELAYAIRGLWTRRRALVFNLNSGTDAAFFSTLEKVRNMPVIMEEYNDAKISSNKFQGLKAAVYDDQGRIKVKDVASNTTHSSKTNAAPILLGQDTPQQDDGSLSNRVIICEVSRRETDFTAEEKARFARFKDINDKGLSNVLLEIVRERGMFERYFKQMFLEEVNRLTDDTWESTVNKEGLGRVIRSIAIFSAAARLVEERCTIKLPWRYAEFYEIATQKIVKQMESISTTSKVGMFFSALNTLLGNGRVIYGRELKITPAPEPFIRVKDGIRDKTVEVGVGTKILYIHLDSAYSAYCKEVTHDTLSKQTLKNYFASHSAYIGVIKNTRFTWEEADWAATASRDGETEYATKQMQKKSFTSLAYMFKYDALREMMDIDFVRENIDALQTEIAVIEEKREEEDRPF